MQELAALLDKWTPAAVPSTAAPWGALQYGSKQTTWSREAKLPADLEAVVKYLRQVDEGFRLVPVR